MPGKSASFTPSSILFRPRRKWWSRRVPPPGPKGLLRRPFIAISGLRQPLRYRRKRLPKKEYGNRAMKLISGGQSGVDRAVLDVAEACGIAYGGWCPRGGWAEDFPQPPGLLARYPNLKQTPLADPAQRTEWNVRDADACMIIVDAGGLPPSRGTELARSLADRYAKPVMVVDLREPDALQRAARWLRTQREAFGSGLNLAIGGPRESEAPGIQGRAAAFIRALLKCPP